ncbi:16S rRNA (cytosine(967)-C(5))-methyltransferase, partial [hydrothermal vent metagenome]
MGHRTTPQTRALGVSARPSGNRAQRRRTSDGRREKPQATAGFAARKAAVDILAVVLRGGAALDDAFANAIADGKLSGIEPRDRALARLIIATSLRRLPEIEAVLAGLLDRPLGPKIGMVGEILITGIAQIIFLGIAPHAVVNVATAMASADRHGRHYKGLVNGVLRNLARAEPSPLTGEEAVRKNLPAWLLQSWTDAYGEAAALASAAFLFDDPPLDITVKSDSEIWAEKLGGAVMGNGTVRIAKPGRIEALAGFEAGEWWVQDAAASMPARLIGAAPGRTIIDLCAAPGGKTAQLAASGAQVIAVDRDGARAERLGGNLARLGLETEIVVADATAWKPPAPADAVLLDAPCSATGIFRRHPDILTRRQPGQVAKLAQIQSRLIDASLDMLAPGGCLIYCTCSLQKAEGEDQIVNALSRHPALRIAAITPEEVPGFEAALTPEGLLRILPHQLVAARNDETTGPDIKGGSDGFFAARLLA